MASGLSINLGLPSIPETKDEQLFYELTKVYNALNLVAGSINTPSTTGASAGTVRGLKAVMSGATITMAYSEAVVLSSLPGGVATKLPANPSLTFNIATTGNGGLDTGSMSTGFVAVYLMYNPVSKGTCLYGTNVTGIAAPSQYSGTVQLAGYTSSGLVGIYAVSAANTLRTGNQVNRTINYPNTSAVLTNSSIATNVSLNIASQVPYSAITIRGYMNITSSLGGVCAFSIANDAAGSGFQQVYATASSGSLAAEDNYSLSVYTPSTIYYSQSISGTSTANLFITSYDF